ALLRQTRARKFAVKIETKGTRRPVERYDAVPPHIPSHQRELPQFSGLFVTDEPRGTTSVRAEAILPTRVNVAKGGHHHEILSRGERPIDAHGVSSWLKLFIHLCERKGRNEIVRMPG